jgi:hypothetical protein
MSFHTRQIKSSSIERGSFQSYYDPPSVFVIFFLIPDMVTAFLLVFEATVMLMRDGWN